MSDLFDFYPYAERELWETGKCSGTMYCGGRDHYAFLKEALE